MVAHRFLAAALAAGLVWAPLHAKGPVTLQPVSEWEMGDPSPDGCTVVRFFGSEENVHVLRLQQNYPSTGMEFWAAGPAFRNFTIFEGVKLQLREDGRKATLRPVAGMLPGFGKAVIGTMSQNQITGEPDAPRATEDSRAKGAMMLDPERGASAEFVSLQRGSDPAVRLETGGLEVPFAMLNRCTQDLLAQWGLDPDKHRTASRGVNWRNQTAITRKVLGSYREAGLATGERGRINVRLIVDETGKVRDCTVLKSAATEKLNSPVCKIMAEAQFDPALDAEGRPFDSFYATAVTYQT